MVSPEPVPCCSCFSLPLWTKSSVIRDRSSARTPTPRSRTSITARGPEARRATVTSAPGSFENLIALSSRHCTAATIISGSPVTSGGRRRHLQPQPTSRRGRAAPPGGGTAAGGRGDRRAAASAASNVRRASPVWTSTRNTRFSASRTRRSLPASIPSRTWRTCSRSRSAVASRSSSAPPASQVTGVRISWFITARIAFLTSATWRSRSESRRRWRSRRARTDTRRSSGKMGLTR